MKNLEFNVEGLKCGGCVSKIEAAINEESHIEKIEVNLEDKLVSILGTDEVSAMKLKSKIESCGFSVLGMKRLQ